MAPAAHRIGTPVPSRPPGGAQARGEGVFRASVVFGRIGGVEVGANWSWIVIVGLLVASLASGVFPQESPGLSDTAYVAMALAAALLFFASLVAHELGHAIVARREGMEIEGITLWVFGGVARFRGMFPSGAAELRIAIAGPLVSLTIGVVLLTAAELLALPGTVDVVARWLGAINLILLAFNMLPALPLDGGRVLRGILWMRSGDFTRATRTAGALGRLFGQIMIFGGILLMLATGSIGGLWFALIGWFLQTAATAETSLATMRDALGGLTVSDAMAHGPITVDADMTVARFVADVFPRSRHTAYPVIEDGVVVGILPFRALAAVPPVDWGTTRVRDRMIELEDALVLAPLEPLADAAVELGQAPLGRALVLDGWRLDGILSVTDLSRLIELRRMGTTTGWR